MTKNGMVFQQIGWVSDAATTQQQLEWDETFEPMVSCGSAGFGIFKFVRFQEETK